MNKYITKDLIENTYLFCRKRISDSEAAEDLSQDILYEALRVISGGKEFVSFYSWYWRMARNKYADFIAAKQNPALPIETVKGVAYDTTPIDMLVSKEKISDLNYSISRLATIYREIIVRFYLREQSIADISRDLDIPIGTVKRRLFDARKNLKERLVNMNNTGTTAYAPASVNWFWGGSGSKASQVMSSSKMAPQIMVICRSEGKTVNEIADEMGVAPIYIEDLLEKMIRESLLISPAKGKYLANCCVFPEQVYSEASLYANQTFYENDYHRKIIDKLISLKDKTTSLDFYGKSFDYSYLMWILFARAEEIMGKVGKERYVKSRSQNKKDEAEREYRLAIQYTLASEEMDYSAYEKKKSVGWSCLYQYFKTADYGRVCFVNDFECEPFPSNSEDGDWLLDRDRWVNGNNISLLIDLAENPTKELTPYEEEQAADFLKNGLLKKDGAKLIVQIPIWKNSVFEQMEGLIRDEIYGFACEYADIISQGIEEKLLPYVRKDMMSNFVYWDMHMFFKPTGILFHYGWDDLLEQPEDYSKSAAGLYIMKE